MTGLNLSFAAALLQKVHEKQQWNLHSLYFLEHLKSVWILVRFDSPVEFLVSWSDLL